MPGYICTMRPAIACLIAAVVVAGAAVAGLLWLLPALGQECFGDSGGGFYCTGPLGPTSNWLADNVYVVWACTSGVLVAGVIAVRVAAAR